PLGKGGTPAGTAATPCGLWLARLALPGSGFGHVIAPLWLIEMQLLLSICENSQVRHRPLLAKIGGNRASCPINLEFTTLCALGHSRLGPLSCHTNSFAICLAVCLSAVRPFHIQISFSAFHIISKHASCMRPFQRASGKENRFLYSDSSCMKSHTKMLPLNNTKNNNLKLVE
uniref:Uncharacterized protein n=1 Tax=Nothobranchius furzeri TaxID=105023 RepID=A0A8C6LXK7_NOTFU